MKRWGPILGALLGAVIGFALGWHYAADDIHKVGDWRHGAQRFIGFTSVIGLAIGYIAMMQLTRGAKLTRDGFTVSYKPAEAVPDGYRELKTLTVGDLVKRLEAVGYQPALEACDMLGQRMKPGDPGVPLVGANVALVDPGVRGWVRVQLPPPAEGQKRAMGLVEIWSERGESAEEMALFTLRMLGELVHGVAAARESSRLSEDPVAMLTAGLAERPKHRG
ncbi:MAG TPA: hypothetical protein VL326_28015 [Kofleriaceae bacterium]|nr:hypothetical protein [Kofleriaceae bacterium]